MISSLAVNFSEHTRSTMLFTTFLAIASFATSAVLANPLPEHEPHFRPRALKNCQDWSYGSLTANVTGRYLPFTLNKDLELSFNGNQTDYSLKIMYQVCESFRGLYDYSGKAS